MDEREWLVERFSSHSPHLRAVAYRMLGSLSDADDAMQEAWLRISRADTSDVVNLGGWLTTVVGRVCLDMLRARTSRREESLDGHLPELIVSREDHVDPEQQALIADSVGLAMLVVLETLSPAERLAFVVHDMFAVPFEDIAPIVGRNPAATRQLASRARRRVRGSAPVPDADLSRQRAAVDAFLAASRSGDFDALVAVLDPEVVLRAEVGTAPLRTVRGAHEVASQSRMFWKLAAHDLSVRPALVNGVAGVVASRGSTVVSVLGFTVVGGLIAEIDILADHRRLSQLDFTVLDG